MEHASYVELQALTQEETYCIHQVLLLLYQLWVSEVCIPNLLHVAHPCVSNKSATEKIHT